MRKLLQKVPQRGQPQAFCQGVHRTGALLLDEVLRPACSALCLTPPYEC